MARGGVKRVHQPQPWPSKLGGRKGAKDWFVQHLALVKHPGSVGELMYMHRAAHLRIGGSPGHEFIPSERRFALATPSSTVV